MEYNKIKAWVKQAVKEDLQVEKMYHQLTVGQQHFANIIIDVYNNTYDMNELADDWTWFVIDDEVHSMNRGYRYED